MGTDARTGVAVAVAGAAGGLALLTGGGVAQAATAPQHGTAVSKVCRYEVTARTLSVRTGPGIRFKEVPPALRHGAHIGADCRATHGWVRVWQGVTKRQVGKWVARRYLKPIRPHHGPSAGAGGTSAATNPMLAGAGLGAIALGGGVAVAARRRRAQGAA
ncbi:hypothetical protein GCM10009527_005490 [Actinomadura nitritigenes]|uniref:SH3 domain-containing protein n=1 Tax=Actinomadura nitritigenes TaxID=134602 RepID=A0ABS3REK9_9ACTN|nr:hypothetical protein [Actinomadura nitritigenes]MBO2444663.1 hypothetical protein [Actinomadura nitritigenes]